MLNIVHVFRRVTAQRSRVWPTGRVAAELSDSSPVPQKSRLQDAHGGKSEFTELTRVPSFELLLTAQSESRGSWAAFRIQTARRRPTRLSLAQILYKEKTFCFAHLYPTARLERHILP